MICMSAPSFSALFRTTFRGNVLELKYWQLFTSTPLAVILTTVPGHRQLRGVKLYLGSKFLYNWGPNLNCGFNSFLYLVENYIYLGVKILLGDNKHYTYMVDNIYIIYLGTNIYT